MTAPVLIPVITPGFGPLELDKTVELTRIMLLSPILLALGAVATSILNAQDRFAAAAMAPAAYNLAIIGAAIFLAPSMGVDGLAIGVVAGSALALLVQLRALRDTGYRYRPEIDAKDPAAREAFALMAPRAVGLGVSQLTFLVSTSLASGLGVGSITALNVAFTILQIPIGVIGVPLGVVVFPSMARELARGATAEFMRLLTQSLRLLLYVMLPITGLTIVLREQLVAVLFGYGQFDEAAVQLTADTLLYFMLGLAAHSLIAVVARAFYAGRDTRTPVAAAILAVAVNVPLAFALVGPLGLPGLALAVAIGAWVEAVWLIEVLRRRYASFDVRGIVRAFLESGVGAVLASVVSFAVLELVSGVVGPSPGVVGLVVELVLASAAGGLAYLGASVALRIPELPTIVAVMADLLRRPGAIPPR